MDNFHYFCKFGNTDESSGTSGKGKANMNE